MFPGFSKERARKLSLLVFLFYLGLAGDTSAQKRRVPPGGHTAVVVDERLAALRSAPDLSGRLLSRLSRGRLVSIRGATRSRDGLNFYRVQVSRRKSGWLESEAVVAPWRAGDDERLLRMIRSSEDFERVAQARIFLDMFPRSLRRPAVLLLYGDAAEEAAKKLTREARRRREKRERGQNGDERSQNGEERGRNGEERVPRVPEFSYFLNDPGLDRYNRQGVRFVFDAATKSLHYDGAAWREILRRYPQSAEAGEARNRLEKPRVMAGR